MISSELINNPQTYLFNKIYEKKPEIATEYKNLCASNALKTNKMKVSLILCIYGIVLAVITIIPLLGYMYDITEGSKSWQYNVPEPDLPIHFSFILISGIFVYIGSVLLNFLNINSKKKMVLFIIGIVIILNILSFIFSSIPNDFFQNIIDEHFSLKDNDLFSKHFSSNKIRKVVELLCVGILFASIILIILGIISIVNNINTRKKLSESALNYYNTYILPLENLVISEYKQNTEAVNTINLGNLKFWDGNCN